MTVLEKNLDALRRYRPELYRSVDGWARQCRIQHDQKSDGSAAVVVSSGADEKNSSSYSFQPAQIENREALASLQSGRPRILICDGIGTGEHLIACQNYPKSVRHFLVLEKQPALFLLAMRNHDWRREIASTEWEFFIGLSEEQFLGRQQSYLLTQSRVTLSARIAHWFCQSALTVDGDYYLGFAKKMAESARKLLTDGFSPGEDNVRALRNIFKNADWIEKSPTLNELKDSLRNVPAVVIAAGPSLKFHFETLKSPARDKVFVACCDGALGALQKQGIVPDLVVSSERGARQKLIFEALSADYQDVPLLTLPSLHPDAAKAYPGPIVLARRPATFGAWLWPESSVPDLPLGVAGATCATLIGLGCASIALLGQDLSYAASGESHIENVPATVKEYVNWLGTDEISEWPGHDGKPVRSNTFWLGFLKEISSLAAGAPQTVFLNVIPKDHGAMIPGIKRMDPREYWTQMNESPAQSTKITRWRQKLATGGFSRSEQPLRFERLKKELMIDLQDFSARLTASYQDILTQFHDDVDLMSETELNDRGPALIDSWYDRCSVFLQNGSLDLLLSCVTAVDHLQLTHERENLPQPETGKPWRRYVQNYWLKVLAWHRMQISWCAVVQGCCDE